MTEEEKQAKVREVIVRYRLEIEEIRSEFNKEIEDVLKEINDRKLSDVKSKLDIQN